MIITTIVYDIIDLRPQSPQTYDITSYQIQKHDVSVTQPAAPATPSPAKPSQTMPGIPLMTPEPNLTIPITFITSQCPEPCSGMRRSDAAD